ncbi:hypothetical protein ACSFE6_25015 [Pseudomonas baetica]|uniref:hypothetical protein n=1 Tax=Pseudomonas baetica TaxID=674054 RepID=UPI003EEBA982
MLAMVVNDDAVNQIPGIVCEFFASELAPAGSGFRIAETTRGAEAPQEVVACSIFVFGFGLLVFVERPCHEVFLHDPPNREPRANGLLWSLNCSDLSIQPVQALS